VGGRQQAASGGGCRRPDWHTASETIPIERKPTPTRSKWPSPYDEMKQPAEMSTTAAEVRRVGVSTPRR